MVNCQLSIVNYQLSIINGSGALRALALTPSAKRKRKKIPSVNFFAEGVLNSLAEGGEKCPKGTTSIVH
jgi:hypothetical protein